LSLAAARREEALRERRCIVTGEVLSEAALVRFCADPDGNIVPDVAATLPGRGLWVSAQRALLDKAVEKKLFAKAAKAQVRAGSDLADRTEQQIVRRMLSDLGLARRSGALVLGFDNVLRAFDTNPPPSLLVEASDGAADGKRKLSGAARARELEIATIDCLSSEELALALGRENVIHAALKSGRLSERLVMDAGRLNGFRAAAKNSAGSNPARHERDE
jgi:hypothetical protein